MEPEGPRCAAQGPVEAGLLAYLPPRLRVPLQAALPAAPGDARWLEVRLRRGVPIGLVTDRGDRWIGPGGPCPAATAWRCEAEDVSRTVQLVTRASVYAWEDELAQGFCTLPGGHRAGLAGRALHRQGAVTGQKDFSSICLRVARAIPGASEPLLRVLARAARSLPSALIFGPPGCGKTTLLRDLCRQLSGGRPDLGLAPRRVGIVDERSELAGSVDGCPQFDLGPRTDVLDGWPKAEGLLALVRGLGPEVAACDELGGAADAAAVAEAGRCGVTLLATAHGGSVRDLLARPGLRSALDTGAFALAARLGTDRRLAEVCPLPARPAALHGGEPPWLSA